MRMTRSLAITEAESDVHRGIISFMEVDRFHISLRDNFNNWLVREDLNFVIDTRTGEMLLGQIEIGEVRMLACLDSVMDDSAAFVLVLEKVR